MDINEKTMAFVAQSSDKEAWVYTAAAYEDNAIVERRLTSVD
jgi:hypothetical protein